MLLGLKHCTALVAAALLFGASVPQANATTWNVPGNYATVQAAINDAAVVSNDVIEVTAPKAEGNFVINNGKNLTIRKVGAGAVTMSNQCNLLGTITARVEGIDITSPNIGVYVDANSSVTLNNVTINATSGNSAVYTATTAGGTLRLENCALQYSGAGTVDTVSINGPTNVTLSNTDVTDSGRVGVLLANSSGPVVSITNGSVIGNNPQFGVWALSGNSTVNISDSYVSTNTLTGVRMESVGGVLTMSNAASHNNGDIGVFLVSGTNATLTNCIIRNNSFAGLVRQYNAGQATTISVTGGEIRDNNNYGIDLIEEGTLNLTGVQIRNHSQIGVFLRDRALGPVTMNGCTLAGNSINSMRTTGATGASVLRGTANGCIFRDGSNNTQANVWLINGNANFQFTNCVFDEGNSLLYGRTDASSTSISLGVNFCTFVSRNGLNNTSILALAEVSANQKIDLTVYNSIFSGARDGIWVDGGSSAKSVVNNYNLMNAQTNQYLGIAAAGANDRTGDPKFVTATTGVGTANLHLQSVLPPSPAIDAANLALAPGITADIEGTSRPLPSGTVADMGAYEEIAVPVELSAFDVI